MNKKQMLDHIERWLINAQTHPHIEHNITTDIGGTVTDVTPEVVETLNKDAMLAEWTMFVRPDIEAS